MRDDAYRLTRIVDLGSQLLAIMQRRETTLDDVLNDVETQWLVTTPLYNIGEQVNCLSPETTEAYPEVPWASIAGLRHRLVHDYEGTNWSIVGSVIFDELPPFLEQVASLLKP